MTKARDRQSMNIRMSPATREKLRELAAETEESQAQVVRRLVVQAHNMIHRGIPVCASGSRCLVPAMWSMQTPAQAPATHTGSPPANFEDAKL